MIVDNVPSFTGEFVFCPNSMFFVSLARIERRPSYFRTTFLGRTGLDEFLLRQFLWQVFGRKMSSPIIEEPVASNFTQLGLVTGTEPLEILEQKLDKLVEESRSLAAILRNDIPRRFEYFGATLRRFLGSLEEAQYLDDHDQI